VDELVETVLLAWWQKTLQKVKFLVSKKLLLVPIPYVQPVGWSGTEKNSALAKCTA
jgi:hypothetical protein